MVILKKNKKYRHNKLNSDNRRRISFFSEKVKRFCTSKTTLDSGRSLFFHHIILLLFLFVLLGNSSFAQTRKTISLNSSWQTYLLNQEDTNNQWNSKSKIIQTVSIPHNWDDYYGYRRLLHGNLHGSAMYKKTFSVQKEKGKKYFLFFEGVGSYATVWVNNKRAGYHAGGRTTFTLDVTPLLQSGKNDLLVRADHPSFRVLIPAFSLPSPPAILTDHLRRSTECSPYHVTKSADFATSVASVRCLSPVTFSARIHLTSELLRFL